MASFILLTSGYCLLAYVPFTYQQMVVAAPLPWLSTFVRLHPYIYCSILGIQALTLLPDLRLRQTRVVTVGFLVFGVALGVILLIHPVLAGLENDIKSLYWGLAFLTLLPWLATIDWLGERERLSWGTPGEVSGSGEDHRIFRAAWQSAVFLALLYSAIYYLRSKDPGSAFGIREGILSLIAR